MKKLEKQQLESSTKGLDGEESDKESNRNKDSDDEHIKRESLLGSMSIKHIQSLIVNAVKAQMGEDLVRHVCTQSLIRKGLMSFICLTATNILRPCLVRKNGMK